MKPIYILRGEQRLGPFQPPDVQRLLNTGQLDRDEPAWTEGFPDWEPLYLVLPRALYGDQPEPGLPLRPPVPAEATKRRPFLIELPRSFLYPLRGHGILLLLGATGGLIFAALIAEAPGQYRSGYVGGIALILTLYILCYYASFVLQVIRATASGDDELPNATDVASVHDEMSSSLLQFLGTAFGCLAPAGFAFYLVARETLDASWLPAALLVAGLTYLPMGVLATAILGSVAAGLTPWIVVPAIVRSLPRYLLVLFLLAGTSGGALFFYAWLDRHLLSAAAAAAVLPVLLYVGVVQGRLLGLIFKNSRNRLGWFG